MLQEMCNQVVLKINDVIHATTIGTGAIIKVVGIAKIYLSRFNRTRKYFNSLNIEPDV